jgi:hypothetical protein
MADWTTTVNTTGYDKIDDLQKRAKVRESFAQENGLDPNNPALIDNFDRSGAFDKEKAYKQQQTEAYANPKQMGPLDKIVSTIGQVPMSKIHPLLALAKATNPELNDIIETDPRTGVPIKYLNPQDAVKWYDQKNLALDTGAYGQGMSESPLSTSELDKLSPEARIAVVNEVNKSRNDLETRRANSMGTGEQMLSKAADMAGVMSGSPSTIVAPAAPLMGPAAPYALGGLQGAESAYASKQLGRDASYAFEIAKGMALGKISMMGAGVGGKIAQKIPVFKTASRITGEVLGAGAVGSVVDVGSGLWEGKGLKESAFQALTNFGGNTLAGAPFSAMAEVQNKTIKKLDNNSSQDYMKAREFNLLPSEFEQVKKAMAANNPSNPLIYRDAIKAIDQIEQMPFNQQKPVKDEWVKRGLLTGLEVLAETHVKALWKLNQTAKLDIADAAETYPGGKFKYMDDLAKGKVPQPPSMRLAEVIKDMASEDGVNVYKANKVLEPLYIDPLKNEPMTRDEIKIMESYTNSKNLINIYDTQKAKGKDYILPDEQSPLNLRMMVEHVEGSQNLQGIKARADWIFDVSKKLLKLEKDVGITTKESYDSLIANGDNIGVNHLIDKTMFDYDYGNSKGDASSKDPIKFIDGGSSAPIETDLGQNLYKRIIVAEKAAQVQERNVELVRLALSPNGSKVARIMKEGYYIDKTGKTYSTTEVANLKSKKGLDLHLVEGEDPHDMKRGEASITYFNEGEPIHVAVPEWFKRSLEKMPIGHDPNNPNGKVAIRVLGWLTGSIPTRALTVGLNPEFAATNFVRDNFAMYRKGGMMFEREKTNIQNYIKALVGTANPGVHMLKWGKALAETAVDAAKHGPLWQKTVENLGIRSRMTKEIANDPYKNKFDNPVLQKTAEGLGMGKDVLQAPGAYSEDLTRVATFKTAIDLGYTPKRAGTIAGEMLDYNRAGTISKILDAFFPFTNVATQALRADIRAFKANPNQYMARMTWALALGALGAGLAKKEIDEMLNSKQKAANWHVDMGIKDKMGNPITPSFPLDQFDRMPVQYGKAIMNAAHGEPVDWESLFQSMLDNVPFSNVVNMPSTVRAATSLSGVNRDWSMGGKIWYGPEAPFGSAHATYDKKYDNAQSIKIAQTLYTLTHGKIDIQPSMLAYSAKQLFPSGMLTDTTRMIGKWGTDEFSPKDVVFAGKFMQKGDSDLPYRKAAEPYMARTGIEKMSDYRKYREASRLKNPQEYINYLIKWGVSEKNPEKMERIFNMINPGLETRALKEDTSATGFMKAVTDPIYWDEIDKKIAETKGKSVLDKNPKMMNRSIKANALGGANGSNLEQ